MLQCTLLMIATSCVALAGGFDDARDWPQWRGPDRNGVSRETAWVSEGRAENLWKTNVGIGYASFAVSDGRVYTTGHDEEKGADTLWCLDAETGKMIWIQRHSSATLANFHGGGTLATPAVDGDLVYAFDHAGKVFCVRAGDGETHWTKDLVEDHGAVEAFHGYAGSPVVLDDRIILSMGGKTLAIDKTSGAALWETKNYGDGSYSTPVDFEIDGKPCLAAFTGVGLAVLDRATGGEIAFHEWKAGMGVNVATPIVAGDRLFISSAYQMGCAMLEPGEDGLNVAWQNKRMRNKMTGCVLVGDYLYGFDESILKCIDLEGAEKWRLRGLGMGTITAAGDRLIVMSGKGELIIASAAPEEFRELSRAKVLYDGVYWTTPVISGGLIYCRNSLGDVVCRDHRATERDASVVSAASGPRGDEAERPADLPVAEDLFRKHLVWIGLGSGERLGDSMVLTGSIQNPSSGETGSEVTIYVDGERRLLTYGMGQFGTMTECYDGEIGWKMHPFFGNEIAGETRLREMRETVRFADDLDFDRTYGEMKTTGVAEYGGERCYVVETTSRGGAKRTVYFGTGTPLIKGRSAPDENMVIFTAYGKYDDLLLPRLSELIDPDTGEVTTLRIENVEFRPIDSTIFDLPEPIRLLTLTPEEIAAIDAAGREKHGEYLGRYLANFDQFENVEFEVVISNGNLALVVPEQPPFELAEPDETGRRPFAQIPAWGVSFVRGDDGSITALKFHDPEREFELPRQPDGDR